jgi:hypothetical protein
MDAFASIFIFYLFPLGSSRTCLQSSMTMYADLDADFEDSSSGQLVDPGDGHDLLQPRMSSINSPLLSGILE